jgi:SAM-dependent methyltransferase
MVEQPDGRSGPGDGGADELRARLHGMWAAVAGAWGEHAAYADERGAHAAERMLELTRPQPGERVLELACGPGALGRAAAERVAPGGEVVFSDVVADMTSIAVARATALGVRNVSARVLDIESIDEPDGAYDVVLCREGLMFAVDPARAVREMARVLRPGGRVALAVWGPRERNPWLGLVFDAVSAELGAPMPPPGVPGPFSLQDADRLAGLLVGAELDDVAVSELAVPLRAESFEAWWARTSALAGPLSKVLGALPDDAMRSLRARTREAISAYETPAGIELPGVALLASARAPSARAR